MGHRTVGIFGLGLMGSAFARHLHRTGHQIVAWNRTPANGIELANEGVVVCAGITEAIECADVVILLPGRCDQATAFLSAAMVQQDGCLDGKDILNLASGTPRMVRELDQLVRQGGARFASGTILCYPGDIGKADAAIMLSGDEALWQACEPVIASLAGASAWLGCQPSIANALEAALVGCVVQPAQAGIIEAFRFLESEGISPDLLVGFLPSAFEAVQKQAFIAMGQIARNDFVSDEPTISNYTRSQALFVTALQDAAVPNQMAAALLAKLERIGHSGGGNLAFAGIYRG